MNNKRIIVNFEKYFYLVLFFKFEKKQQNHKKLGKIKLKK